MNIPGLSNLPRMRRVQLLLLFLCALAGIGIGAIAPRVVQTKAPSAASSSTQITSAYLARKPSPALAGLTDQNGRAISLRDERGHVVFVAFMDPRCVNLCPVLGREISALEQQLPKGLDPILLIVSLVAGRTSTDVQHFIHTNLSTPWLPDWHWLIGPNAAALELAWLAWGEPAVSPNIDYFDVIDRQGFLRVTFAAPLAPLGDVVSAIKDVARGYVPA